MKKLLLILSSLTVTTSLTTSVVACSTWTTTSISALNFKFDLTKDANGKQIIFGKDKELNQKDLLLSLIMLNHPELEQKLNDIEKLEKESEKRKTELLTQRQYELYADLYFDLNTLIDYSHNNFGNEYEENIKTYKLTLKPNTNSRFLSGQETVIIKATDQAVENLKHPVKDVKPTNSTYWYQWSTLTKDPNNPNDPTKNKELKTDETFLYNMTQSKNRQTQGELAGKPKYDIINLSYMWTKNSGDTNMDLWLIPENQKWLNPEFDDFWSQASDGSWNKDEKLNDNLNKWHTDLKDDEKRQDDVKYIASIGGATSSRMEWKWKHKNDLKKSILNITNNFLLDGFDLSLAGKTLFSRESSEVLAQVVREITLEQWLRGEDFIVTLSPKWQYLNLESYRKNQASYVPIIESLEGWYSEISILLYNSFNEQDSPIAQEDINLGTINGSENEYKVKKGQKIKSRQGEQSPLFYYAAIRSVIDPVWSKSSGFYPLVDKPVKFGVANPSLGFGFENNSTSLGAVLEQLSKDFNAIKDEYDYNYLNNIIGFNVYGINDDYTENIVTTSENKESELKRIDQYIKLYQKYWEDKFK